jgi:hypothetical protein
MAPLSRITALARRQHRVISLGQLRRLGCSYETVRHLVCTQRLWRVHRGVYALDGPLGAEGRAMASVLACRGAVSHLSAAFLTGLVDRRPAQTHITVLGRSGVTGPHGVTVHHARHLTKGDMARHLGIPVTSPARTVLDCSPLLGAKALKEMLRRAEHDGLDLTTLGQHGIPRNLRRLLDHYVVGSGLTANQLEQRFYEICATAGLPPPEVQAWFPAQRRVDFVWHPQRLIAETDGRRAHDSFIAFTDDRARDRAHAIAGYTTVRFTWREVELEPDLVADDLSRLRDWGPGGGAAEALRRGRCRPPRGAHGPRAR